MTSTGARNPQKNPSYFHARVKSSSSKWQTWLTISVSHGVRRHADIFVLVLFGAFPLIAQTIIVLDEVQQIFGLLTHWNIGQRQNAISDDGRLQHWKMSRPPNQRMQAKSEKFRAEYKQQVIKQCVYVYVYVCVGFGGYTRPRLKLVATSSCDGVWCMTSLQPNKHLQCVQNNKDHDMRHIRRWDI